MSASLSQNLLLTIALAPLVGAVVAGLFGKTVGRRGAHLVTILGVLVSFIGSVSVLSSVSKRLSMYETFWNGGGNLTLRPGSVMTSLICPSA